MSNFLALLILSLISVSGFAQRSNKTTIHFRLSDGQPMVLTINDRQFQKVNTKITLFDLPRKRHSVQIYRFRPYADGKGGKAELVYSGRFKVDPGSTYDAVVDVSRRKLLIKDLGIAADDSRGRGSAYMPPPPANAPDPKGDIAINSMIGNTDAKLLRLHQDMLETKEDSKKLEKAKQYVAARNVSSSDLRTIAGWIMFDDNKLDLLKYAYTRMSDEQNFEQLSDVFTMPEAQNSFKEYCRTLR